jgi:L-lactate dehydrogenase (cytochrome)
MDVATESSYVPLDEVRRHATDQDCWIIVHSKVYDVSNFHSEHPGGAAIILKYAGADATAAYDEIHAPGIIGDTLPEDCLIGLINAQEMAELQEQTKAAARETAALQAVAVQQEQPIAFSKPKAYEKPDLFKLISVHDFEDVARNTLTEKAWAFFSSAATDLVTHHNNSDYYKKIMIRPRILRTVKEISIKRTIMGCESSSPFFISPAAMAKLAHPEGELALAQGAAAENIIQCVSHSSPRRFNLG